MVQNDFLDTFGDPIFSGKVGTDIQENKLTWFSARCMEKANDVQKQILAENYGSWDPLKVARVKQLFADMDLIEDYREFKKEKLNFLEQSTKESGILKSALEWVVDNHFRVTPYNQQ